MWILHGWKDRISTALSGFNLSSTNGPSAAYPCNYR